MWYRVFGRSDEQPAPGAILEHLAGLGVPVPGRFAGDDAGWFRAELPLGDGTLSRPAAVRAMGSGRDGSSWIEIVLTEGKNRQVRKMAAAVGHDTLELVRPLVIEDRGGYDVLRRAWPAQISTASARGVTSTPSAWSMTLPG